MDIVVDIVDNHFNPRLREGGDLTFYSSYMGMIISIHASAKEATKTRWNSKKSNLLFQSTPPRRRRLAHEKAIIDFDSISIHASAKEATRNFCVFEVIQYFNPRLREGGDIKRSDFMGLTTDDFNPRLREGGDWDWTNWKEIDVDFNPRLREGGDQEQHLPSMALSISIHASAKEATATYCDTSAIMYISSLNNFFVHFF